MTSTVVLDESDTVTLDGSGNGTLRMRPDGANTYWLPETISEVAPNPAGGLPNSEAQCSIYIGPKAASQYLVDATFTGSSGNSTDRCAGYRVGRHADPYIIAVWVGGDPGAAATMRVRGMKEIP